MRRIVIKIPARRAKAFADMLAVKLRRRGRSADIDRVVAATVRQFESCATSAEAAAIMGLPLDTFRARIGTEGFPRPMQIGNRQWFSRADLARWKISRQDFDFG